MKNKIVLTEDEILAICHRIGGELTNKLKNEERTPLFLGVMKGALNFMSNLIKGVERPIFTDFLQITSYRGTKSTGKITLKRELETEIKGRSIVIVEDVIDTGISMKYLIEHLNEHHEPKQIIICTLFDKVYARKTEIEIDYVGKVL
ncbi:MAG: hypoxanthine phosphoribosyltransferase, partial [Erysipelotrichia bacterium]|nr:hypoxanthine phosphoribosyltransferase [Erysipelotrichia bacterium]